MRPGGPRALAGDPPADEGRADVGFPARPLARRAALGRQRCDLLDGVAMGRARKHGGLRQPVRRLLQPGTAGEGTFKDVLDGLRDDPQGPRLDMRREVFPHLGPQFWQITDNGGRGDAASPDRSRWLTVVECRDVPAVTKAMERYYEGDETIHHETLDGRSVWTVEKGHSLLVEGEGENLPNVRALTITDAAMVLSSDPEMLTGRLRQAGGAAGGGPRLCVVRRVAQAPRPFAGVLPRLPPHGTWLEGAYEVVRSGKSEKKESWQVTAIKSAADGFGPRGARFPVFNVAGICCAAGLASAGNHVHVGRARRF